jgi:HTH-type transcriptional regulator/antitoxin HigA
MSDYKAPIAIHPGETLKDILNETGLSQAQLSGRTGLHVKTINEIIKGKNPITSETALKLSIVFGMSEGFWNNLQRNYEETLARIALEKEIEKESKIAARFTCYNELVKHKYVERTTDLKDRTRFLLNFLGLTSFKYLEKNYRVAFRKSSVGNVSKENLIAWLRCGEIAASVVETKPFNKAKLKQLLPKIRKLNLLEPDEYSIKLRHLLAECGVAVAYVPYLKNTYVNGATRWLSPSKVLVQLTPRNKSEDILWFTLFHELCHVLKHGRKEGYISFWGDDYLNRNFMELEHEADLFATETLIPAKGWDEFLESSSLRNSEIIGFAKKVGVKPGIVAGRLAKETGNWARFSKFREKVEVGV